MIVRETNKQHKGIFYHQVYCIRLKRFLEREFPLQKAEHLAFIYK